MLLRYQPFKQKTTIDLIFMRLFLCCLLSLCYFVSQNISAQSNTETSAQTTNLSLGEQFEKMVKESNNYQRFKVIPVSELATFKVNMEDSLTVNARNTAKLESTIDGLKSEIATQTKQIADRDETIATLNKEKDGISLFGNIVSKTLYNSVLWGLAALLLAGLLFFFGRSRYAVSVSREMESSNAELTAELEQAKRRRLEVEQDLRRKLQDERNKRSNG